MIRATYVSRVQELGWPLSFRWFGLWSNALEHNQDDPQCLVSEVLQLGSSGDTIPNCLGEFREIRESKQGIGITPYGHPAGTPGATGVDRPWHEGMVNL